MEKVQEKIQEQTLDEALKDQKDIPVKGYKQRETGALLTDPQEIAFYKTKQQNELLSNLLLGNYTSSGDYQVSQEFIKELVSCNKVIKENFDNSYLIIAKSKRGAKFNLKFTLTISKDEKTKKKIAVLRLLETMVKSDGETPDKISTIIARYKDDDDIYFFTKIKKIFNISTIDDSIGKDIVDESQIAEILKRQMYMSEMYGTVIPWQDKIAKIYIERLLKVMVGAGEFGKFVLKGYESSYSKIGDVSKAGTYTKLFFKLDALIMEASKKYSLSIEDQALLSKIKDEYLSAQSNMLMEANTNFQNKKQKQEEEAKEKSSGSSSSSGKKSSSSSKSKAKANKEEKEKKSKYFDIDPSYLFKDDFVIDDSGKRSDRNQVDNSQRHIPTETENAEPEQEINKQTTEKQPKIPADQAFKSASSADYGKSKCDKPEYKSEYNELGDISFDDVEAPPIYKEENREL